MTIRDKRGGAQLFHTIPIREKRQRFLSFKSTTTALSSLYLFFSDYTGRNSTCHDPKQRSRLFAELTKHITTLNPSACLAFSSKTKQDGTDVAKTCWPYRALQSLTNRFGLTDIRFRRVCQEIDIDNIGKGEHYQKLGTIIHKANNQSLDPREGGRLYEHVKIENAKITTEVGTEAPA